MQSLIIGIICFIVPITVLIKPSYQAIKNKQTIKEFIKNNKIEVLLYFILAIGSCIRIIGIDKMPNALNVDEASSGYEAYSIMKYGIDRNGNSYPVFLYAWGSGQNALYSYLMIPFILLCQGLTLFSLRVPMAVLGILSLYVMYYVLKNIFSNKKIALIGVAFFAICPWHIMKSRWALESNTFPDLLLLAVLALIVGLKNKKTSYQLLAFLILGITSYAYGTAYLFLPIFVIGILGYLIKKREITFSKAMLYLGIVGVISLPMILYVIINTFDLPQIKFLGITIPRMQLNRYEEVSTVFSGNLIENCVDNLLDTIRLLILQTDGLEWNAMPIHGLFYGISIPVFIIGAKQAIQTQKQNTYHKIMNIWMIASIFLVAFCEVNINRINVMMIPCIYYIILGIDRLQEKEKKLGIILFVIYIISFTLFMYDYRKQDYNNYYTFNSGIEELSKYCEKSNCEKIYCDYTFKEPYIYFLFYQEYDVKEYIRTVEYFKKEGTFDNIKAFGKYTFALPETVEENSIVIVPKDKELTYEKKENKKITINQFDVYEF